MQRRTLSAIALGGTLGAVLGIAVVALAAGRVIGAGVEAVVFDEATGATRATFLVGQAGMYLLIVVAGGVGGVMIAAAGYGLGTLEGPETERFSLGPLALIGAVAGAVIAFAAARTAIGVGGTISEGVVSLSVFRAAMVALIAGATTGVVVGGTVERIGRPEVLGLQGAAWPSNPLAFARDAIAAMGLPTLGIVVGLAIVFTLSRVLLEADKTTSLVVFGAAAALILFGAAAIAAMPPRRKTPGE